MGSLGDINTGFCCLGLASHLAGVPCGDEDQPYYTYEKYGNSDENGAYNYVDDQMPPVAWFEDRFGLSEKTMQEAATRNDGGGLIGGAFVKPHSFVEIADWLETEVFPVNP